MGVEGYSRRVTELGGRPDSLPDRQKLGALDIVFFRCRFDQTDILAYPKQERRIGMPVITFDKEHLDEGFMFLARRGEVGCLPNDVFVITDTLFELLQKSHIPFVQIDNHRVTQQ